MCMECEKKIFVKCIKSVHIDGTELLTAGKTYGAFTWYFENEDCYNLSVMNNDEDEHVIAEAIEDDIKEYLKYEFFQECFELVS